MCNRYASDIRKYNLEREYYGFEEISETRINPVLANATLEVFPKSFGPVIHAANSEEGENALTFALMRWGIPNSEGAFHTNIRQPMFRDWRALMEPAHRCLVPFTAFSEFEDSSDKGKKIIRWFASPDRAPLYFAGVWTTWSGDYGTKKNPNVGEHALFSFLTTAANDLVRPVHSKAMPVILRDAAACEEWLTAPASDVPAIQKRVLPADALEIVPDDEATQYAGAYLK